MNKKIIFAAGAFIVFSVLIITSSFRKENASEKAILFYGDTCPHCKIVDDYIEKNGIKEKFVFLEKEVYRNQANAAELKARAEFCGLPSENIGVPFFFDGEKCLIGDQDIIDYFSSKL